jgi:Na+-translocating ferredoxin:NAD+ oxidoreductase RnfG subunit
MSFSVTFSRSVRLGAVVLAFYVLVAAPAAAKVFLGVDEALKVVFPGCKIERRTAYLTPAQVQKVKDLAGVEVPSALVSYYTATRNGQPAGTAYFDTHKVRTLPETLMIVVDPQGKVARIEVISFREPEEYMPRAAWYQQFLGKRLDADLQIKRSLRPVTGATLTARATTDAVRRVLAEHQVVFAGNGS